MHDDAEIVTCLQKMRAIKDETETVWYGSIFISPMSSEAELTIHTHGNSIIDDDHALLIRDFLSDYHSTISILYTHIQKTYANRVGDAIYLGKLREMYLLSGIELKADKKEWWFTLEPLDVPTNLNFFMRFTMVDKQVVWSNF